MSEINFGECGLCLQAPCTCNDPEPEQETCGLSPTCPACGATIYEGDFRMEDGDEEEVTCDGCGTTYVVRLVVSRDYYSRLAALAQAAPAEEPKPCDHTWGIDGAHSNVFCKKCFETAPRGTDTGAGKEGERG